MISEQDARARFEWLAQQLNKRTTAKIKVQDVDDPINLYNFNIVCNNSWQVMNPTDQKNLLQFELMSDQMNDLICKLSKEIERFRIFSL